MDQESIIKEYISDVIDKVEEKSEMKKEIEKKDETIQISKQEYEELKEENERLKKELKNITMNGDKLSFQRLIKQYTPCVAIKATPELIREVEGTAKKAQAIMKEKHNNKFPVNSKGKDTRVNECGNFMEKIIDETGEDIIHPLTDKGKIQGPGYPDREKKDKAYLEIKLMDSENEGSTFRSFYISTFNKVNKSLPHLVVVFKHKNRILTDDEPLVIDLYDQELTLKCEWQTNNKKLCYIHKGPEYTIKELENKKYRELQKMCTNYGLGGKGIEECLYKKLEEYYKGYYNS